MLLSRLGRIAYINLKHNFMIHFGFAILLAVLTILLFDVTALEARGAAKPIEMFLSLSGAVVLVPVFQPEQEIGIKDVVRSKKLDYIWVCLIRVIYATVALAILIGSFVGMMRLGECAVTMEHFAGGFASAFLLGVVGLVAAGVSQNTTVGYMVAFIYYLANLSLKKKLGVFFLFSMYAGEGENKGVMILIGVGMVVGLLGMMKVIERKW